MTIRRKIATTAATVALILVPASASRAAESPGARPSPWDPLRFLLGSWSGEGRGQPGTSSVEREYRFVLRDRFIEVHNASTYPPREKNPKGELHEDRGYISWDRGRRRFVRLKRKT